MTKTPTTYHQNKPSKWPLLVVIMVGVLAFSGDVFHTSLQQGETIQIEELLHSQEHFSLLLEVSYNKVSTQTSLGCYRFYFKKYPNNFLSTYNTLCKVQTDSFLTSIRCFTYTFHFLPLKTIPISSSQDKPSMG